MEVGRKEWVPSLLCGGKVVNDDEGVGASAGSGGIQGTLLRYQDDEGYQAAIEVAEDWRNTLEAMLEVANREEVKHIRPLHTLMQDTIGKMLKKDHEIRVVLEATIDDLKYMHMDLIARNTMRVSNALVEISQRSRHALRDITGDKRTTRERAEEELRQERRRQSEQS